MHVLSRAAVLVCVLLGLSRPLAAQARLQPSAQARAISAAYAARVSELGDSAFVARCALALLLGDSVAFRTHLSAAVRARLRPRDPEQCAAGANGAHPPGAAWYVEGVAQEPGGEVEVRSRLRIPHSRERTETYRLRPRGPGDFHVTEIRLGRSIEKVTQPLVPPRTPPVVRPGPAPVPAGPAAHRHE